MFCSKCGTKIADSANYCQNCGAKIISGNTEENNERDIYNVSEVVNTYGKNRIEACKYLHNMYGISLSEAKKLVDKEHDKRKTNTYSFQQTKKKLAQEQYQKQQLNNSNIPTCPKCNSISLSANKKGFGFIRGALGMGLTGGVDIGLITGGLGSNKIEITCLNCGYKFKPGKH